MDIWIPPPARRRSGSCAMSCPMTTWTSSTTAAACGASWSRVSNASTTIPMRPLCKAFSGKRHPESTWVGWPGIASDKLSESEQRALRSHLRSAYRCDPVLLNQRDIEGYYHGFSNGAVWPLFHYFPQHALFDEEQWFAYERVNALFA